MQRLGLCVVLKKAKVGNYYYLSNFVHFVLPLKVMNSSVQQMVDTVYVLEQSFQPHLFFQELEAPHFLPQS